MSEVNLGQLLYAIMLPALPPQHHWIRMFITGDSIMGWIIPLILDSVPAWEQWPQPGNGRNRATYSISSLAFQAVSSSSFTRLQRPPQPRISCCSSGVTQRSKTWLTRMWSNILERRQGIEYRLFYSLSLSLHLACSYLLFVLIAFIYPDQIPSIHWRPVQAQHTKAVSLFQSEPPARVWRLHLLGQINCPNPIR